MTKTIFILLILCFFSCNQTTKKGIKKNAGKTEIIKNEIVFVFKKQTTFNDEINRLGSNIYYTEKKNFIINEISPNNKLKSDTLTIPITADKIFLSHKYGKTKKISTNSKREILLFSIMIEAIHVLQ